MHRCRLFCHNQGIYLDQCIQVTKHWPFHDGGCCGRETSPLIWFANQWTGFYIIRPSVMKKFRRSLHIIHQKFVLTCCKAELTFLLFFLLFHSFHRHFNISKVIAAEGSSLCISGSWKRANNLYFHNASH